MKTLVYEYIEPRVSSISEQSLLHVSKCTESAMPLRILGGCCDVKNLYRDEVVELKVNYFYSDFRINEARDIEFLNSYEEDVSIEDYESLFSRIKFKNRAFYKTFLNEITSAVYNEATSNHTAAFVHLYRAYENISYAFPLIYASKTDDFYSSYKWLSNWVGRGKDSESSERAFFKSFISSLYANTPEYESTLDIDISIGELDIKNGIFSSLTKKVLLWNNESQYSQGTIKPEKISIPFKDFHSFILTLRNRYFHLSHERNDNISHEDIIDSNLLFSLVNKSCISYLATVYHSIVSNNI